MDEDEFPEWEDDDEHMDLTDYNRLVDDWLNRHKKNNNPLDGRTSSPYNEDVKDTISPLPPCERSEQ